ncbi:Aste57867_2155 [Aphanomyces stellatus]|uniref:Pre-mRNA-processing factor 19 n=1 Tax=Aphanomyces stellatus TaxID=120398 RepID=A0A485K7K5_9STRA|nr:hypothetical protein As57867_002150 [Aphanomyces stellatus]KAF0718048.1 hypothetical protein As57867_001924 [Aphanomyces stellatus]KAF0718060.1 hypothetical protein As57867_001936 [Aphanomyces stellatus]VFT79131.1 Aste57867_1926 [Aphanomyces stellatus]VFT79143.1 Aste57867_1938 [Aphanomyces stellatus]
MLCGLSGAVCEVPVVNIKSGHVYEKRLIEEYMKTHGNVCPLSESPLAPEDLLPLKLSTVATGAAPPSKVTASIPSLLSALQTEYDAHALEMFELKQHLQTTRRELSHALYQYDAACRVIARLNRDIDQLKKNASSAAADDSAVDPWVHVTAAVGARAKELAHYRKKERRVEELSKSPTALQLKTSQTLHQTDKPGVLTVDIKGDRVVTGGNDRDAKIFDITSGKIEATLHGHSKKVQKVLFHPTADVIFTGSADKTVKLWTAPKYQVAHTLTGHDGAVTGLSVHPTGSYLGTSSDDATWAIHDIGTGTLLKQVATDAKAAHNFHFHPDGAIFGTAHADRTVRIWDVATASNVATFEGHTGEVNSLWFSENGYHLVTGGADGVVKFWDLRKLKSIVDLDVGKPVHAVHLEVGGGLLGVATDKVTLYQESGKKNWDIVHTLGDHKGQVTDVKIADQLAFVVSTSLDRAMKVYA